MACCCAHCASPFTPRAPHQRYCRDRCRWDADQARQRALTARHVETPWASSAHDPADRPENIEQTYRAALRAIRAHSRPLDVWAQPASYAARMAPCGPQWDDDERWT